MKCESCGHVQNEGNFCGNCGKELAETTGEAQVAATEESTPSTESEQSDKARELLEQIQEIAKDYWSHFIDSLKNPKHTFSKQVADIKNSIISMVLIVLFISIAFYNVSRIDIYGYDMGPSFFSTFSSTFIGLGIFIAIIIALLYLTNMFFGDESLTFKNITSIYGGHLPGIVILSAFTLLIALANSIVFASTLITIVFSLLILIIPLYIISSLLTKKSKSIDPFYGYLIYIVAIGLAFMIVSAIFVDSMIGQLFEFL